MANALAASEHLPTTLVADLMKDSEVVSLCKEIQLDDDGREELKGEELDEALSWARKRGLEFIPPLEILLIRLSQVANVAAFVPPVVNSPVLRTPEFTTTSAKFLGTSVVLTESHCMSTLPPQLALRWKQTSTRTPCDHWCGARLTERSWITDDCSRGSLVTGRMRGSRPEKGRKENQAER